MWYDHSLGHEIAIALGYSLIEDPAVCQRQKAQWNEMGSQYVITAK